MKVLIISSVALATPPEAYGGLEWMTYLLAKGLHERGHDVTLAASKGSKAPLDVHLIETVDPSTAASEDAAFNLYKERLKDFDVIHDHSWLKWSYMAKVDNFNLKLIATTHSQCPYRIPPPVQFPNFCAVSHGHASYMSSMLKIPIRYVYNGIEVDKYPFQQEKGKRYLSVNRIMPEKGIHVFIDLMRQTRVQGDIMGEDVQLIPDHAYVTRCQRLCDGLLARYFGSVSNEDKLKALMNAKALLCLPIPPYIEVFGLAAVEALSCGTPVITLRSGGLPEIVEHGKSGFICDSVEEIAALLRDNTVSQIRPEDCRKRAELFTYQRMAEGYEQLYKDVLDGREW